VAADPLPPELAALRAKAETGNAVAQYNLGLAYAEGRGIPVDRAEAYVWLTLQSDQGSRGTYIGVLVARMSDDELAEGKRRLGLVRTRLGVPAAAARTAAAPTPGKGAAAPAKEQKSEADLLVAQMTPPTAETELGELRSKAKELQDTVAQQTALNQQLSQQLDERSRELTEAVAALRENKDLLDSQDSGKVAELATARKALEDAKAAAGDAKKEAATRIAALERDLARRSSEADALSAKLAADEAALRAAGAAGSNAQALSEELERSKGELSATRSQLAEALRTAEASRAE